MRRHHLDLLIVMVSKWAKTKLLWTDNVDINKNRPTNTNDSFTSRIAEVTRIVGDLFPKRTYEITTALKFTHIA